MNSYSCICSNAIKDTIKQSSMHEVKCSGFIEAICLMVD